MRWLFSYWDFQWTTLTGLVLLVMIYLLITGFRIFRRTAYFTAGILVLCLCLLSPLHYLAMHDLFSAHMLSHVLIILVAAPLLVAGIPPHNRAAAIMRSFSRHVHPLACWLCGVGIMWVWHVPAIFNFMFSMKGMMLMPLHHWSTLLAGVLFCWPIVGPYPRYRLGALRSVLYLSTACIFCSLLGLMITFADPGTFTPYMHLGKHAALASMVRGEWEISAFADQQMAGLIMWVPCCILYLTASMLLLLRWFRNGESRPVGTAADVGGFDIYPN